MINQAKVRAQLLFNRKDKAYLDGSQPAPYDLVVEINDKIDYKKSDKVLVLFDYVFAVDLVDRGIKDVTVAAVTLNPKMNPWLDDLGIKTTTIEEAKDMKFDVVVGNPPYQQLGSKNTIYQHFYNTALQLSDVVALVTPRNMINSLVKGNCDNVKIEVRKPSYVCLNDVERHFKGVGSDFCWFIIDSNDTDTTVETVDGLVKIDVTTIPASYFSTLARAEFTKSHLTNNRELFTGDAGKDLVDGDEVIVFDTVKNGKMVNVRKVKKPTKKFRSDPYKPKILFNIYSSGKKDECILDLEGNVLPSAKHCVYYVTFDSKDEALKYWSVLDTDIFNDFVSMFSSRSTLSAFFSKIDVDHTDLTSA